MQDIDYLSRLMFELVELPENVVLCNLDDEGRYWIATDGRLLSLCKEKPYYKKFVDDDGLSYLYTKINGEKVYQHRAMALAFNQNADKEKIKNNCVVHHLDFNCFNNSLDNLCILAPERHYFIHSLYNKWENHLCQIK